MHLNVSKKRSFIVEDTRFLNDIYFSSVFGVTSISSSSWGEATANEVGVVGAHIVEKCRLLVLQIAITMSGSAELAGDMVVIHNFLHALSIDGESSPINITRLSPAESYMVLRHHMNFYIPFVHRVNFLRFLHHPITKHVSSIA